MVDELENLIEEFPGQANRTRCFAHIINLVAKSLLKQFDIQKKRTAEGADGIDAELLDLARDIEIEEVQTRLDESREDVEEDNVDGWIDEVERMSEEEHSNLAEKIRPVRMVLVKVS
jgi:hypothetical protein